MLPDPRHAVHSIHREETHRSALSLCRDPRLGQGKEDVVAGFRRLSVVDLQITAQSLLKPAACSMGTLALLCCGLLVAPSAASAVEFNPLPVAELFRQARHPMVESVTDHESDYSSESTVEKDSGGIRQVGHCVRDTCGESGAWGCDDSTDHLVRFRAGLTQVNKVFESHVGGTWGLDGVVPVDDHHGAHWAARVNQFSGGTQYQGSLGGYERSAPGGDGRDRFGASVIVDLFHDSRVNDMWLTQLRGQAGVALSATSAVGVAFTVPLNDERSGIPPGFPWATTAVDSVGAYATEELMNCQVQAGAGYREKPNSAYLDLAVRRRLAGDNLFAYASTNYIADRGQFGTWIGIEYRLGGSDHGCGCECARREAWDDPVIWNSFNYGENSFWHNTDNPAVNEPDEIPE